ncbi:hypothetical protein BV22DRAFT_1035373 [Leucogyrophana mollusca]|uniref:Uncharacterized protein n=1 Tax=Leucogyrophana mollusca TaxID=85980 RepID=A0ACB8BG99_9AGAM|nr:hypothetical protein BV22DRAFT_1035373 [Leucogyrophana mollusca]
MRSFSTLSLIFTAALSAFTYAAPATTPDVQALTNKVESAVSGVDVTSLPLSSVEQRDETPASVAVILTTLQAQVLPLTEQFTYINSANATAANITPIIAELKTCFLTATASLKLLIGADIAVILAPIEGEVILTVAAVAELLGGVLCILFAAIGCLLDVILVDVKVIVLPLLVDLCVVVAGLLQVVFGLVAGLLAAVLLILTPAVIAVIKLLGCVELLLCLGIKL